MPAHFGAAEPSASACRGRGLELEELEPIANTGPAYPLSGELKGQNAGRIEFTEYGAPLHITAPGDAIDLRPL